TDPLGAFCFVTSLPIERGTMKLHFAQTSFYDETAAEIPFDLARPAAALAFDPEPAIAWLDRPSYVAWIRVTAAGLAMDGWRVVLKDDKQRLLGQGSVGGDGLVRVEVPTERLDEPGPGWLLATLEGALAQPVSHTIERHATVQLSLATLD